MLQVSPEIILNQLMLVVSILIAAVVIVALLIEFDAISLPHGRKNRVTKYLMLAVLFVFYGAMLFGVVFAVQQGIMTIPDIDPFTMRSAFDTISLMLIVALVVPIVLLFLLRTVVRHR